MHTEEIIVTDFLIRSLFLNTIFKMRLFPSLKVTQHSSLHCILLLASLSWRVLVLLSTFVFQHCLLTFLHVKIGSFIVLMIVLSGSDPVFTDFIIDVHTIQTLAISSLGIQSVELPTLLVLWSSK